MEEQKNEALRAMTEWLKQPSAMGKKPIHIEYADAFDYNGLRYYIFKFKKSIFGKWLLGVCGGYRRGSTKNCGHIASRFELYDAISAVEAATSLVEAAGNPKWPEGQDVGIKYGSFLGLVLLNQVKWDSEKFKADLENEWGVKAEVADGERDTLVWKENGMLATVGFIESPIPGGEAEENAASNYMWPEAAAVAKTHTAHLTVAVLPRDKRAVEAGELFVKICCACLMQENAVGLYSCGTVFEPGFYKDAASVMKKGEAPYINWVHFGMYRLGNIVNGYTYGLSAFGKDEMEVVGYEADPVDLRNFLIDITIYVLSNNVQLLDGETLGFSEKQRLSISKSPGVAIERDTLKIEYASE